MDLLDNYAVFELADLHAGLGFKYEYISDPPILGDIGTFQFDLKNTTLILNSSTTYDEKVDALQMDIEKFLIEQEDFKIKFDGISDISDVASRFLTFVGNTLRSRLCSIIKFIGP